MRNAIWKRPSTINWSMKSHCHVANRVTLAPQRGFLGWPGVTLGSRTPSREAPDHRATLATLVTPGACSGS